MVLTPSVLFDCFLGKTFFKNRTKVKIIYLVQKLKAGRISWKIWSIVFARVELTEVEMAEWSSGLLTEKISQLGSQNKKTACYITDETNVTNVIDLANV